MEPSEQTAEEVSEDAAPAVAYPPRYRHKERAGFTTNKGRGQSKARRRMARASRRKNRKG